MGRRDAVTGCGQGRLSMTVRIGCGGFLTRQEPFTRHRLIGKDLRPFYKNTFSSVYQITNGRVHDFGLSSPKFEVETVTE